MIEQPTVHAYPRADKPLSVIVQFNRAAIDLLGRPESIQFLIDREGFYVSVPTPMSDLRSYTFCKSNPHLKFKNQITITGARFQSLTATKSFEIEEEGGKFRLLSASIHNAQV